MMARRVFVFLLFVCAGLLTALVVTDRIRTAGQAPHTPEAATADPQPQRPGVVPQPGGLPDLTAIAERAIAGVTNISSTQIVRAPTSPFANDPFFRYFFGDDPFGYRDQRQQSLGSGVVVSQDGYVLTNQHVVGDASAEVTVMLADKREQRARVVAVDPATDLAVLKIQGTNLPALAWGDSSKLKVAEWVLAIGNPYQLNQTVTLGIVSAKGRSLGGGVGRYEDFIQTDAAINPGNSGGALINARGELVGINTAIFSETGGYQGIGFAVPSNLARHVMDDLIKFGEVQRGTIADIVFMPLSAQLAEQLGAPDARGFVVRQISDRSDAYAAGVRPGDIVVSFDGVPLEDASQFVRLLSDAKIGSTVTLGLLRDGRKLTAQVPIVKASAARTRRR